MSFAPCSIHSSYTSPFLAGVYSSGISVRDTFSITTRKIHDTLTSPQGLIGFGLGLASHRVYTPLTEKILKALGRTPTNPFLDQSLGLKILLAPLICILNPVIEEEIFRRDIPEALKNKLESFYENRGFSDSATNIAARMTSVFFTSVIFGLVHFTNAIFLLRNPIVFLPQVISTTIIGLICGFAKEFSGKLDMPIGIHLGNNIINQISVFYLLIRPDA